VRSNSGFTLVELLVSIVLLSMIILAGSSSFWLFSQRWDGQLGRFDAAVSHAKSVMLTQDILNSLFPYVAYKNGIPFLYFEGNRNGFVSVSSKSILSYGDFSVVRFSVSQNDDLTFDVLYEEWPMDTDLLVTTSQRISFSPPLTLYKSVRNPRFEYFGWNHIRSRVLRDDMSAVPAPVWSEAYNGVEAAMAPIKARLTFETKDGPYSIMGALSSENPGLLSRYKQRLATEGDSNNSLPELENPAEEEPYVDDCDC